MHVGNPEQVNVEVELVRLPVEIVLRSPIPIQLLSTEADLEMFLEVSDSKIKLLCLNGTTALKHYSTTSLQLSAVFSLQS